eukprot:4186147-Amphidinium_carterae.1
MRCNTAEPQARCRELFSLEIGEPAFSLELQHLPLLWSGVIVDERIRGPCVCGYTSSAGLHRIVSTSIHCVVLQHCKAPLHDRTTYVDWVGATGAQEHLRGQKA